MCCCFVNALCLKGPQILCLWDSLDISSHKTPDLNFNVACLISRRGALMVLLSVSVS